jgi:hypothetical protein
MKFKRQKKWEKFKEAFHFRLSSFTLEFSHPAFTFKIHKHQRCMHTKLLKNAWRSNTSDIDLPIIIRTRRRRFIYVRNNHFLLDQKRMSAKMRSEEKEKKLVVFLPIFTHSSQSKWGERESGVYEAWERERWKSKWWEKRRRKGKNCFPWFSHSRYLLYNVVCS